MKGKTIGSTPSNTYEVQLCTITACNTSTNVANATILKGGNPITIDLSITTSNIVIYPQIGEVWYVKNLFNQWILEAKHPYQNAALNVTANPGDMVINNSGGKIILNQQTGAISTSNVGLGAPVTRTAGAVKGIMLPVTDSNTGALIGYIQLFS